MTSMTFLPLVHPEEVDPHECSVQGRGDYILRMSDKELRINKDLLTSEDGRRLAATFMQLGGRNGRYELHGQTGRDSVPPPTCPWTRPRPVAGPRPRSDESKISEVGGRDGVGGVPRC
jgi:hypothetical protein